MGCKRRWAELGQLKKKILVALLMAAALGITTIVLKSNGETALAKNLGIEGGRLKPCPDRQNCRNSDDPQERFQIEAIEDTEGSKWHLIAEVMASLPRVKLVEETEDYLHFTQTSGFFHFVDDIEFHNRPETRQIAIRSASRLGYRDFGVNQARLDDIDERLNLQSEEH